MDPERAEVAVVDPQRLNELVGSCCWSSLPGRPSRASTAAPRIRTFTRCATRSATRGWWRGGAALGAGV